MKLKIEIDDVQVSQRKYGDKVYYSQWAWAYLPGDKHPTKIKITPPNEHGLKLGYYFAVLKPWVDKYKELNAGINSFEPAPAVTSANLKQAQAK